jgi:hypothetical protein
MAARTGGGTNGFTKRLNDMTKSKPAAQEYIAFPTFNNSSWKKANLDGSGAAKESIDLTAASPLLPLPKSSRFHGESLAGGRLPIAPRAT